MAKYSDYRESEKLVPVSLKKETIRILQSYAIMSRMIWP